MFGLFATSIQGGISARTCAGGQSPHRCLEVGCTDEAYINCAVEPAACNGKLATIQSTTLQQQLLPPPLHKWLHGLSTQSNCQRCGRMPVHQSRHGFAPCPTCGS